MERITTQHARTLYGTVCSVKHQPLVCAGAPTSAVTLQVSASLLAACGWAAHLKLLELTGGDLPGNHYKEAKRR
jgi:hypothetical protein